MRDSDIDTLSADGAQETPPFAALREERDNLRRWHLEAVAETQEAERERDKALWDMGIMAGRVAALEDGLRRLLDVIPAANMAEARALLAAAPSDRCPVCLSTDRSPRQRGQSCPDSWHVAGSAAPSEPPGGGGAVASGKSHPKGSTAPVDIEGKPL